MSINTDINQLLSPLDTDLGSTLLKFFIILYASLVAPKLPQNVLSVIKTPIGTVIFLSLITWSFNHDPVLSILISVAFYATITQNWNQEGFLPYLLKQNNVVNDTMSTVPSEESIPNNSGLYENIQKDTEFDYSPWDVAYIP
jgi:hypothetical protein